jgi:hypothetical protein
MGSSHRRMSAACPKFDMVWQYPQRNRLLNFFSIRLNWDSPAPKPIGECVPAPGEVPSSGGTHSLAGGGWGGPNSAKGTDTVVL